MASVGLWRSPVLPTGGCPDTDWFGDSSHRLTCPGKLRLTWTGVNFDDSGISFNGGAKVGTYCGASAYVTISPGAYIDIDVWAAYRAGVWTSSLALTIYHAAVVATPYTLTAAKPNSLGAVTKSTTMGIGGPLPPSCPLKLQATVTVTDAGVLTIA